MTDTPTTLSIATATAILGLTLGYLLGTGSSLGLWNTKPSSNPKSSSGSGKKQQKKSWPNSYDVTVHPDSSDEELMGKLNAGRQAEEDSDSESDSEEGGGDLAEFGASREECKLVLVVRGDLGMGKGKIAAQCSHATLACYDYLLKNAAAGSGLLKRWRDMGQAKVAVQCKSVEELEELQAKALSLGLCAKVIHDAGRTQIAAGSATVLGIGPGPKSVIDQVTGHLKLL